MAAVGEFESLSVPQKPKGTAYVPSDFRLTETSRFALTARSDSGGYRTFDSRVNKLLGRDAVSGTEIKWLPVS